MKSKLRRKLRANWKLSQVSRGKYTLRVMSTKSKLALCSPTSRSSNTGYTGTWTKASPTANRTAAKLKKWAGTYSQRVYMTKMIF